MKNGSYQVLIVDDCQAIREVVSHRLEAEGFCVRSVGTVEGFLEELGGPRVDAVLMDVVLGQGMTNQGVFDSFRASWPEIDVDEDRLCYELGLDPDRRVEGDLLAVLTRLRWKGAADVLMFTNGEYSETHEARLRPYGVGAIVPKLLRDEDHVTGDPECNRMLDDVVSSLESLRRTPTK